MNKPVEAFAVVYAAIDRQTERLLRGDKMDDVEQEYRDAVRDAVPVIYKWATGGDEYGRSAQS